LDRSHLRPRTRVGGRPATAQSGRTGSPVVVVESEDLQAADTQTGTSPHPAAAERSSLRGKARPRLAVRDTRRRPSTPAVRVANASRRAGSNLPIVRQLR